MEEWGRGGVGVLLLNAMLITELCKT